MMHDEKDEGMLFLILYTIAFAWHGDGETFRQMEQSSA